MDRSGRWRGGKGLHRYRRAHFSPDSQRVAYEAQLGEKWIVVVDGVEGKGYDGFLRGSQIIFDSSERLHSLAINGNDILLLTVRIK